MWRHRRPGTEVRQFPRNLSEGAVRYLQGNRHSGLRLQRIGAVGGKTATNVDDFGLSAQLSCRLLRHKMQAGDLVTS